MELIEKIQVCNSLDELPNFKAIKSIPRGIQFKIIFNDKIKYKREEIGENWKLEHPEFKIGIHTVEPEINLLKLITDNEIEEHQDFFEKCAKDYKIIGTKLITELSEYFEIEINLDSRLESLNPYRKNGFEPVGEFRNWKYSFHGRHCGFVNQTTGQNIEVPLNYGLEFGQLDPYFFSNFIKTSLDYYPLPVQIFNDYADGCRIINQMSLYS